MRAGVPTSLRKLLLAGLALVLGWATAFPDSKGSFENDRWCEKLSSRPVSVEEMRDPLPEEVVARLEEILARADKEIG